MKQQIHYLKGEEIPYTFTSWVIVLSCLVSLLGSGTTVELLHRRQTRRGWMCQLHLALCAVSFGLVAIWCMHFVGNKAIVMGDGRNDVQLSYSPGYTALSAILPVLGLYLGFSLVDRYGKAKSFYHPSLIITGVIAGLSIMGMHYIGNLGTSNYHLQHASKNLIGAALIAVFDCWFAFTVFFHLQERWINYWYLRVACTFLLAAAVSGMHWTAAVGTTYNMAVAHVRDRKSQDLNVILACVLCALSLITALCLFYWTNRHQQKLAARAHQVVLAALIRDEHGHVLVTTEGLLPSRTITTELYSASSGNFLDKSHSAFLWMYRISHNWNAVSMLIPRMRDHLQAGANAKKPKLDEPTFRAQFCVAAHDLAGDLGFRIQDVGVLHTEVIDTGSGRRGRLGSVQDVESVQSTNEDKGQTLFISRHADARTAQDLVALGFRFAPMDNTSAKSNRVLDMMASKMQVGKSALYETMHTNITRTISSTSTLVGLDTSLDANKHYISLFALRPRFGTSTCPWDILVYKEDTSMIPIVSCDTTKDLDMDLQQTLPMFAGKTLDQICAMVDGSRDDCGLNVSNYLTLVKWMNSTLHTFREHIPAKIFQNAIFCPTPVKVPTTSGVPSEKSCATIWSFVIILDVHDLCNFSSMNDELWSWIPFSFFQCLQATKRCTRDQIPLAQKSYVEFSSLFARTPRTNKATSLHKQSILQRAQRAQKKVTRAHGRFPSVVTLGNRPEAGASRDNCSEKGLVRVSTNDYEAQAPPSSQPMSFGGILVSEQVVQSSDDMQDSNIEMQEMGLKSTAEVAKDEELTWADELYGAAVRQWLINKPAPT